MKIQNNTMWKDEIATQNTSEVSPPIKLMDTNILTRININTMGLHMLTGMHSIFRRIMVQRNLGEYEMHEVRLARYSR